MQDNVSQCCVKHSCVKLVSCLSTCIFPDKVSYPITEQQLHAGPLHDSNVGYSYAKRMVDVQNRMYNASNCGCLFTSVIPTNTYGKHDNFNLADGHVIANLVHKCSEAKQNGTVFTVCGSGEPLRQFMYSLDLARLMQWAVLTYSEATPIILANPQEYSISEIAKAIAEEMRLMGKYSSIPPSVTGSTERRCPAINCRLVCPNSALHH